MQVHRYLRNFSYYFYWLTDEVCDICLPVIVGGSFYEIKFCLHSVSFVSDMSPS